MDSSALKRVIKVEKSIPEPINLRRIFGSGSCGEIRALHASGFIEFANAVDAQRALSLKHDIPGIHVLDVASEPRLVEQYLLVNPSAFAKNDLHPFGAHRSSDSRTDDCVHSSRRPEGALSSPASEARPFMRSSEPPKGSVSQHLGLSPDLVEKWRISDHDSLLPAIPSISLTPSFPVHLSSSSSTFSPFSVANPFPCIQSHILMRLCGENISLDLRSLADNAATVIELLNATLSERGNWLIVGAYYRRSGDPVSAITVITGMLEAMKQFNIPENDLKPAFLLLAGCESDLGKLARSKGDTDKISEHHSNAQKWLHRVYGGDIPPNSSSADNRTASPPSPCVLRQSLSRSAAPPASRTRAPSPDPRMLQREIQSLRDRHKNSTNVLADVRASKRKLEDTIEVERTVRRRLQRELDEVTKKRDYARRMESLALDQMKREVDSRRRAEDRAEEERELRKRAEQSAEFSRAPTYAAVPMAAPMHQPEGFYRHPDSFSPAFDSQPHRISF
ncbi:40S ribosomal protein [Favolaschia claudopus]|uniref:40S ribosomal protein n=1 Tax=Favolaschia claudopus TaxID=2862362 RepID=A0AAW0A9Z3_9AGAR